MGQGTEKVLLLVVVAIVVIVLVSMLGDAVRGALEDLEAGLT